MITVRENPIRHLGRLWEVHSGACEAGMISRFLRTGNSVSLSYSYFGDFPKKLYAARFDFAIVPLFWRFPEKNCRPPVMAFAVVPLFWRFRENNCTAPVSILRSYSCFGDFPKKTVQRLFRFCGRTVILEISRKKRYSLHFDFAVIQLFLENSRKKLYFNYFGFNFYDAWRVLIQGDRRLFTGTAECFVIENVILIRFLKARQRAHRDVRESEHTHGLKTSSGRFHAADRNEVKSVLRAVARQSMPWQI